MALTVNDVARHLRYDDDDIVALDLQSIMDSAEQAVKDHVLTKYDAENKIQQRAVLMMCGYFDEHRGVSKDTPSNDGFFAATGEGFIVSTLPTIGGLDG